MNNQNILIYESDELYNILDELKEFLNFDIVKIKKNVFPKINLDIYNDYLILTLDKNFNKSKQTIYIEPPIKFSKLLEKINLQFLKHKFSKQSNIDVGAYKININSINRLIYRLLISLI